MAEDAVDTARRWDDPGEGDRHRHFSAIMWIHNSNGAASTLRVPGMAEPIDIPDSGVVQVSKDDGELLIENCPTISEHEPDQ